MLLEQAPSRLRFQHVRVKGVIVGHLSGCELIFILLVISGHTKAGNVKYKFLVMVVKRRCFEDDVIST